MSSIIKNKYLNIKNDDHYIVDSNVVYDNLEDSNYDEQAYFNSILNDIQEKIKKAEIDYNRILADCETKIQETNQFIEDLKEKTYNEAFNKGYDDGNTKTKEELEELKKSLHAEYNEKVLKLEEEKKQFVINAKEGIIETIKLAVNKVVGMTLEDDDTRKKYMELIVFKGLNSITDEKEVKVLLSEEDFKNFSKEDVLSKVTDTTYNLTFVSKKDLETGSCLIETDLGYIDVNTNTLIDSVLRLVNGNIN